MLLRQDGRAVKACDSSVVTSFSWAYVRVGSSPTLVIFGFSFCLTTTFFIQMEVCLLKIYLQEILLHFHAALKYTDTNYQYSTNSDLATPKNAKTVNIITCYYYDCTL